MFVKPVYLNTSNEHFKIVVQGCSRYRNFKAPAKPVQRGAAEVNQMSFLFHRVAIDKKKYGQDTEGQGEGN